MKISGPKPIAKDTQQRKLYLAAGAGIALLSIIALSVIFVLPETVKEISSSENKVREASNYKSTPTSKKRDPVQTTETSSASRSADFTEKQNLGTAENLLRDALRLKSELEGRGVKVWGKQRLTTSYTEALIALKNANTDFDSADYKKAVYGFQETIRLLNTLQTSINERFIRAVTDGRAALETENYEEALSAFKVAAAIAPEDQQVASLLKRARLLPEVIELMKKGRRLDLEGNLDAANEAFRKAANLDPEYHPVKIAANRTQRLIADRDYRDAISKAIIAIDERRFEKAAAALSAALKIKSGGDELRELQNRLEHERQAAIVEDFSRRALQSQEKEEWQAAAKKYGRILEIDPNNGTAKKGLERSKRMLKLHRQIELYIKKPERLSSDEPLDHAKRLLKAGEVSVNSGPRLAANIRQLEDLIKAASVPQKVVIKSDGKTFVTIYRIGRFGSFSQKIVSLKPGNYTAVGNRPGYRDVRIDFRVVNNAIDPTTIVVQCLERI